MTVRIIGAAQMILGTLQLPASTRLVDLETLRQLGALRIEVITNEQAK
ncbi:hypothetical protein I5S84_23770 [Pseudomonas putida]|nr:hypothetical protein [Pseudomonas putida]MBH3451847.1 hypothetical protein [Pseudomonas putida]